MTPIAKPWYTSKTIWFAVLTVLIGVAGVFGFGEFAPDASTMQVIETVTLVVVGLGNLLLRYLTKEPIA